MDGHVSASQEMEAALAGDGSSMFYMVVQAAPLTVRDVLSPSEQLQLFPLHMSLLTSGVAN